MPDMSQVGAASAVVVVVYLFLKFMREQGEKNDESLRHLSKSIDRNTEVSDETHRFLKNLNGKLEEAVVDKVKR